VIWCPRSRAMSATIDPVFPAPRRTKFMMDSCSEPA
jgi:hypothetical protein